MFVFTKIFYTGYKNFCNINELHMSIYQAKGKTIEEQYYDVGTLFGESIRNSVAKIAKKRSKLTRVRRQVAEKTLTNIVNKVEVSDFLKCLKAWCQGAKIELVEGMWLLADNLSGCQTMIARYGSGVALIHTEEEFIDANHIDLHMSDPNTISFNMNGQTLNTLVYNDLLPGCGLYGFKENMIVAVDSLFLVEEGIEKVNNPLLANIVSWLVWRMDREETEPSKIVTLIHSLGEVVDGYAINVVRKVGESIEGYKLTIVRNEHQIEFLGKENGSHLRQTNIVDPKYPKMEGTMSPKNIWRGGWKYFKQRLMDMDKHAKIYRHYAQLSLDPNKHEWAHRLIQKTIFTDLRKYYVNPDLGAVCIGLVDSSGTSVSVAKSAEDKEQIIICTI